MGINPSKLERDLPRDTPPRFPAERPAGLRSDHERSRRGCSDGSGGIVDRVRCVRCSYLRRTGSSRFDCRYHCVNASRSACHCEWPCSYPP